MEVLQAFWLAFIQGFTEFLPISSSGHLALVPHVMGWPDQGLGFDIAVHVGSLMAVVLYFRRDLCVILRDWYASIRGGPETAYSRLAWSIAVATVFVGLAGTLLVNVVSTLLRNPVSIAFATLVFGVIMGLADRYGKRQRTLEQIGWLDVVAIGLAQVLALIPGTSRSGITITAGLIMGLTREAAARFSFLLAIPVILMAGIWQARNMGEEAVNGSWPEYVLGTVVSFVVAWLCIHFFLRYVARFSLLPFVIYRVILGVILLAVFM